MAQDKKSIIVYADWIELFETLTDEESGKLIKHFFRYVNDQNPEAPDRLTELSFIPIKQSLKRDLIKWENTLVGRSRAGKASAEAKKREKEIQQNSTNSTSVDFVQQSSTHFNKVQHTSTNSTDSVSVNVSVSDIKVNNDLSVNWDALLNQFNSITGKSLKVVDDKVKRQVIARLKSGYSKNDIVTAITNCFNDPYHIENPKYLTLEFISRPDKMATYSQEIIKPKKLTKQQERL